MLRQRVGCFRKKKNSANELTLSLVVSVNTYTIFYDGRICFSVKFIARDSFRKKKKKEKAIIKINSDRIRL